MYDDEVGLDNNSLAVLNKQMAETLLHRALLMEEMLKALALFLLEGNRLCTVLQHIVVY